MQSWIGLYALLKMIRDAKITTFTRQGITTMLQQAKDVPMLGMFGDESWTPNLDHPGIFKRAGMNHWAVVHMGSEREIERVRRQLRREVADELRQGAVRFTLRCRDVLTGSTMFTSRGDQNGG